MSRKRPAPDAAPMYQNLAQHQAYGAPAANLSDEQFLQWSGNLQDDTNPVPQYDDANLFAHNINGLPTNPEVQASNQLMRAPPNQLVARPRGQLDTNNAQWTQDPAIKNEKDNSPVRVAAAQDDMPSLQVRAQEAKKEAQAKRKQIPPFVQKLSSFLDQSKNTELIRWSDDGKSFIVLDEDEFAKTLIPELFKHNNYASFVRQLNMYGFHKKVGLADNSMRASERKNKSPSEYSHEFFRRGHPELLWAIQKPKNTTSVPKGKGRNRGGDEAGDGDDYNDDFVEEVSNSVQAPRPRLAIEQGGTVTSPAQNSQEIARMIRQELSSIRSQQVSIGKTIEQLKMEHQALSNQAMTFQEQHARHENSINAILTFLATVYDRSLRDGVPNISNMFNTGAVPQSTSQGNVVDVGDYSFDPDDLRPLKKQPLLLKAPPVYNDAQTGRVSTASPSATASPYDESQQKRVSPVRRNTQPPPQGTIEELFEPTGNPNNQPAAQFPPQDMMSMIQNANARNPMTGTSASDFPAVLNSLENAGGHAPLSSSQRDTMLRLINSTGNPSGNTNNALMTPTPPAMPTNYDARLANTRAEIDRLSRMQAEQDQSVQNLERLLAPLSPSGSVPGIAGDQEVTMPQGLDLDEIFKTDDYFDGANGSSTYGQNTNYNPGNFGDDDLFGNVDSSNGYGSNQNQNTDGNQHFTMFNNDIDADHVGGRVESVASSEATTPRNAYDNDGYGQHRTTRNSNGNNNQHNLREVETSPPTKKRRRNNS